MAHSAPFERANYSLDGSTDVLLAPVRGADTRRDLPQNLFRKHPAVFSAKFIFALLLIIASWVAVAVVRTWPVIVVAIIVLGSMYAPPRRASA